MEPIGIIFTGGPGSVYLDGAPQVDPAIFTWGTPILGICYGCQLMAHPLGGRVTAAGAAIGTVLNIKPVLTIQGAKLDAFAKARGWKAAKKIMLDAMERDIAQRFAGQDIHLAAAYTCTDEEAQEWKGELEARFPGYEIHMDRLSLSVACHIGAGSMAVGCSRVVRL